MRRINFVSNRAAYGLMRRTTRRRRFWREEKGSRTGERLDLKTSRKKVVLCPSPFPNFPLPRFTCVTRYRMYWTRRLSPDLRCSSIHWVRVPSRATVTRSTGCATLAPRHRKIRGALYICTGPHFIELLKRQNLLSKKCHGS